MNGHTAKLIRRATAVTLTDYKLAKREWKRTPRNRRHTLRTQLHKTIEHYA